MKTFTTFAFALTIGAAALTGCATDPADPTDDPSDPNDPNDPDDVPLPEDVDAAGKYNMRSTFDLAANAPGKVGEVTNAIIAATDEGDDPAKWILQQLAANLSGTVKSVVNGAIPFVAGYINDRLLEAAPDFVTTMITLGNDFGEVATNVGLNAELNVTKSGAGWTASHTITGAHFKINGVETDHPFSQFGIQPITAADVAMTLESSGKMTLAEHKVPLQYGQVLRIALDGAIIPSLDPSANNLGTLLQHQVDCNVVGQAVSDAVADLVVFTPGPGVFAAACNVGLTKAADLIYGKIADIDGSALELSLTGTAKALDKDGNRQIDTIQTGAWTGTCSYAGTPAPLATATFYGAR